MPFDATLLILGIAGPEIEAQAYTKFGAVFIYPEDYVKVFSLLELQVEFYGKLGATLQRETGSYIKAAPTLKRDVDIYVKFAAAFPAPSQNYIKTATALQGSQNLYLRMAAQFVQHIEFVKIKAALTKQPPIGEVGNQDPEGKVGLLSRHYLSLTSVKKEV